MQPFVNVPNKSIAIIFSHYLKGIGIDSEFKPASQFTEDLEGWALLCPEEHLDRARIEFEQFARQPNHPRYQQSAWQSGQTVTVGSNKPFFQQFKDSFLAQAGPFTLSIFALCWVVFAATFLIFFDASYQLLMFNTQGDISQTFAQPWRLLTPALFHFSLLHIAFNTMWWWQLGGQIEQRLGMPTLINLFVVSALVSNFSQFYVSGPNFGGLSGVVYAVLGFVWIFGHLHPNRGISLSKPIIGFMLIWLLLGFTEFMPINVANTAHLTGLLSGIALAFISSARLRKTL